MTRVFGVIVGVAFLAAASWLVTAKRGSGSGSEPAGASCGSAGAAAVQPAGENMVDLGALTGQVSYDDGEQLYYLEVQGARLPFAAHPRQALAVALDAAGATPAEKNNELRYGIVGPDIRRVTLLVDPREEADVTRATKDLQRYIGIVASDKLGPIAYTSPGGKGTASSAAQVRKLTDATAQEPIILLKGPESGATSTAVRVLGQGQLVIEGETYESLNTAADLVCLTVVKMLWGGSGSGSGSGGGSGGGCGCG